MAIQSMQLDPNAASYTDNEIVDKVNAASNAINRAAAIDGAAMSAIDTDDIGEGSTNLYEAGDMSGDDIITAINAGSTAITREAALDQDSLNIVKTNPAGGEFLVKNIQRDSTGKLDIEYDDTAQ